MAGPPSGNTSPLRLAGSGRTAFRHPARHRWLLVDGTELADGPLPLGLRIELSRPDIGRTRSAGAERALDPRAPAVPLRAVAPTSLLVVALGLILTGAAGLLLGRGSLGPQWVGAIQGFDDLGLALVSLVSAAGFLRWIEAAAVSSAVDADVPVARWRRWLPTVEPAAWRLDVPVRVPGSILLFALSAYAVAAGWMSVLPPVAAGASAGTLLYLIGALYPLEPGPGARILERITGSPDVPDRLRWSLVQRFLPVRTRLKVEGTAATAWATLALAAWAAGAGAGLYVLSVPPVTGSTFPGRIWQLVAAAGLAGYTVWLTVRTGRFCLDAVRLGGAVSLEPLTPPDDLVTAWREDNPLLRHVGELEDAAWSWGLAPQGTLLTRYGETDRTFYWVARGTVEVVGRTPEGDPTDLGTLGAGVGLGEMALLDRSPRSADVVAARDSVVAVLSGTAFDAVADDAVEARLRDVVVASRSLERSDVFWGLGPADRNRWLSHGRPEHHPADHAVVREGTGERWIGLVVHGSLAVERNGDAVSVLEPDAVFGEMAYLDGRPRTATLRAREPTLIWRWSPEWLDREIGGGELRAALRALAEERS